MPIESLFRFANSEARWKKIKLRYGWNPPWPFKRENDRSPTGTALSAMMAVLHKKGKMHLGQTLNARSIIGSEFSGRIVDLFDLNGTAAILPEINGRGWITGIHQHMLDPDDPWLQG